MIAAVIVIGGIIGILALSKDEVVASVDGEKIYKEDLYNLLFYQYGAAGIDALITDKIIELEAKKHDIEVSDAEIDEELQNLMESYGGEESFKEAIATNGVTISDVKADIATYLKSKKMIEPRISISDDEMKTYFEENKDSFAQPEQIEASHILVETEKLAKEIKTKIDNGEDFSELAKEYSTDTASKDDGGNLGYFSSGTMVAEFEEVAFSLEKGEISEPVKTDYGYHIIKLTGKKAAKEANYEENKEKVEEALFDEKVQTEYGVWLEEVKKDYKIKN